MKYLSKTFESYDRQQAMESEYNRPSDTFVEFKNEQFEQSISQRFEKIVQE